MPVRGPNCRSARPSRCERPVALPPSCGACSVKASPKLLLCVKSVNSWTVLKGMSGHSPSRAGSFVLRWRCGCMTVPAAGMVANWPDGPTKLSGQTMPGPSGANIEP